MPARGSGGHGSIPIPDTAPNRLVRAAARIADWQPPIRLLPQVEEYLRRISPLEEQPLAGRLADIAAALKDPKFVRDLPVRYPRINVLLRSTVSLSMLEAGPQFNVIPHPSTPRPHL